jgi:hypothetical protein
MNLNCVCCNNELELCVLQQLAWILYVATMSLNCVCCNNEPELCVLQQWAWIVCVATMSLNCVCCNNEPELLQNEPPELILLLEFLQSLAKWTLNEQGIGQLRNGSNFSGVIRVIVTRTWQIWVKAWKMTLWVTVSKKASLWWEVESKCYSGGWELCYAASRSAYRTWWAPQSESNDCKMGESNLNYTDSKSHLAYTIE